MKGGEHKAVEQLGRLQATVDALEGAWPTNNEAKMYWNEAVKYARKALLAQWDETTQYIHNDDT